MLSPNTLLQNRYLIVRPIGQGGMGAVYLAEDRRLGNHVALKETFFTDELLRKAFEREARLLASLHHPALPRVIDHFSERDGQFLVMGFIPGEDLAEMLSRRGNAFPISHVLQWADQLLDALDYLHTQDVPIIHRDIKPQNIKLMSRGQIILLDFGLAKGTVSQLTRSPTSSVFGYTLFYAPLEQIQGSGTDPRSDLYSLGATLYHLLTNATPADTLSRASAVLNDEPDPLVRPDTLNRQIPAEIAGILTRSMALRREQRFASASDMRAQLHSATQSFLSTQTSEAQTLVLQQSAMDVTSVDDSQAGEREVVASAEPTSPAPANRIVDERASREPVAPPLRDQPTLDLDRAFQPTTPPSPQTHEIKPADSAPTLPVQYFQAAPIDTAGAGAISRAYAKPRWSSTRIGLLGGLLFSVALGVALAFYFLVWRHRSDLVTEGSGTRPAVNVTSADMTLLTETMPPQERTQLASDEAARKELAKNVRELLALGAEARAIGIADRPEMKRQLAVARSVILGQQYLDQQSKKSTGGAQAPAITDAEADEFFRRPDQAKLFEDFLADEKARNPQQANLDDTGKQSLRRQWAQIMIAERKALEQGLDKNRRVELQIMIQEARALAQQFAKERLENQVKATDAEIDAYVSQHPEIDHPKAREQAEQLLKRVRAGEDFAKLADQYSIDPGTKGKGGDLGWISRGVTVKPFEDAAFSMQAGQISDVVESNFGFHIIKVEERRTKTGLDGKAEDEVRVRHILIGGSTQGNTPAPPQSPRERARKAIEEEKQKKLVDDIVARSNVTVADDFQVPIPPGK